MVVLHTFVTYRRMATFAIGFANNLWVLNALQNGGRVPYESDVL